MRPAARPELLRFLLLPDGSAHAGFSDRSLVVLNPSAVSFVIIHADGTQMRGLTHCVTASLESRVARAVVVRNLLTADCPRLSLDPTPILPAKCYFFDSVAPMNSVIWPDQADAPHVLRHSDGAIRILSVDRRAWLLLHPEGHTFVVCFPASAGTLIELPDELRTSPFPSSPFPSVLNGAAPPALPPTPSLAGAHRFVFCTQIHDAFTGVPNSWVHPLSLAHHIASHASHSDGSRVATDLTADPGMASTPGWLELPGPGWITLHELLAPQQAPLSIFDVSANPACLLTGSRSEPVRWLLPCSLPFGFLLAG